MHENSKVLDISNQIKAIEEKSTFYFMIVLGIDPALNKTGYAILKKNHNNTIQLITSGVIKNNLTQEFPQKLLTLFNAFDQICTLYKPNICGIEETFVNVNAVSSLKLGAARGSIITAVAKNDVKILEFLPNKIKKTVTGAGKADKSQVEFMVQRLIIGVTNQLTPDEYDAIAIAFTAL